MTVEQDGCIILWRPGGVTDLSDPPHAWQIPPPETVEKDVPHELQGWVITLRVLSTLKDKAM
jgi:hypothetical protein